MTYDQTIADWFFWTAILCVVGFPVIMILYLEWDTRRHE